MVARLRRLVNIRNARSCRSDDSACRAVVLALPRDLALELGTRKIKSETVVTTIVTISRLFVVRVHF